ncbi:hypothetical protein [Paenibacillus sp. S-12]|uniref:hypothetical protein n=1 Tax=Paenibacillus sp. S-12 TaxID=3031371 RepID=UPI0025A1B4B7|nr:hypothetical protein [Paenibacillus sp. S-12]
MFQLSLFIECKSNTEALNVLNGVIRRLSDEVTSIDLIENEPYWKVDGWFKTTCNFETVGPLDYQRADKILRVISDKWLWDKGKTSAHSSAKEMLAVFCDPMIQFSTCWFEDFE